MKKRKKTRKTADGRVIVDSRAYGEHIRAPRGTHKEAVLNDAMKSSSAALAKANSDAKRIKAALEPYLFDTKPRLFWQRLVSAVRNSYDSDLILRPEKFEEFDVYDEYRITRLLSPQCSVKPEADSVNVSVRWNSAPNFKRRFPDGYMFGAICIYADPSGNEWKNSVLYSEAFPLSTKASCCEFIFDKQISSEYMLIFLIINATEKKVLCKGAPTSGFRCIWGRRNTDITEK